MSEKLKPCPFCGGKATQRDNSLAGWMVFCDTAGCRVVTETAPFDTRDQAIEAWNNRAAEARIRREAIEECEFIVDAHIALHRDNGTDATRAPLEAVAKRLRALAEK